MAVSAEGKGLARTESGDRQEEDGKGTTMEMSKAQGRYQNRGGVVTAGPSSYGTCFTGVVASGMRKIRRLRIDGALASMRSIVSRRSSRVRMERPEARPKQRNLRLAVHGLHQVPCFLESPYCFLHGRPQGC
jgi:hypothetical protein